jgi:N-methylhydantoinase A
VLGILNPDVPLGGEIALDLDRARAAIADEISDRLGESVVESAWGVYQVITAQMADAIERYMVSNGVDPRQHALMAFGAAAPAHALAIAARLGAPKVIIPAACPIFSAYGLMMTDIRHAYEITDDSVRFPIVGADIVVEASHADRVRDRLRSASRRPQDLLDREQIDLASRELALFVDMRYSGQELQLAVEVPIDLLEAASAESLGRVVDAWRRKYDQVYGEGASWSEGAVEIVNYRAVAVGRLTPAGARRRNGSSGAPSTADVHPTGTRQVFLGAWHAATVYANASLVPGCRIVGPAVVDGDLTTVVLGPGDELVVDAAGNFVAVPAASGWRW